MSPRKVVASDKGLKSSLLSQATIHGNTVYVSGHIGLDIAANKVIDGSVADRTRQAILNLQTVLKEAGSSLHNLLKVISYYTANS